MREIASVSTTGDHGNDPADKWREERAGQARDEVVRQVDRPRIAEHEELQAHQRERARQRDDEGRDSETRDHEAVEQADGRTDHQRGEHRQHGRDSVLDAQDRHGRSGQAAERSDGKVDLPEQEDEHDADRDGCHGGLLEHQVRQVARAQEAVVLELEEDPDHRDHHDDEERTRLALPEPTAERPERPPDTACRGLRVLFGCAHASPTEPPARNSSAPAPNTAPVIAPTTSS